MWFIVSEYYFFRISRAYGSIFILALSHCTIINFPLFFNNNILHISDCCSCEVCLILYTVTTKKKNMEYSQFISNVTELLIGVVMLLLDAWHVIIIWRCFLCNFSRCNTFLTLLSDNTVEEWSSSVFSCHHVTFGNGLPIKKRIRKWKEYSSILCLFDLTFNI